MTRKIALYLVGNVNTCLQGSTLAELYSSKGSVLEVGH